MLYFFNPNITTNRKFNRTSGFRTSISNLFIKFCSPSNYKDTLKFFSKYDKDGNGEITIKECLEGIKSLASLKFTDEKEIDSIFKYLDENDNRKITINDLIVSCTFDAMIAIDEKIFEQCNLIDKDGTGEIKVSQLKTVLNDLEINFFEQEQALITMGAMGCSANKNINACHTLFHCLLHFSLSHILFLIC